MQSSSSCGRSTLAHNGRHPASLRTGRGAKAACIHARAGRTRQIDLSEELPGRSRLKARQWGIWRRPAQGFVFRQHWGSGDVSALFGYVNALMPADRPGQLSPQSYADLTAFLLSNNGYAPGAEELTPDQDAQRKMTLKK